jgi:serine protease
MRVSLAAILLALLLPVAAPAASDAQPDTDRIIVRWRNAEPSTPTDARTRALAQRTRSSLTHGRELGGSFSLLRLSQVQRGATLAATLAALRADPEVALAVPDRPVRAQRYTPSDPLFAAGQWYLQSVQPAAIRADAAWDITRGGASPATSPVVIAVLDTGVRRAHPDLAAKLLPGYDFVSDSAISGDGDGWDTDPEDAGDFLTAEELASPKFTGRDCGSGPDKDQPVASSWHGTRVAGLLAADTDNGTGIAGAGFNVRLVPVRVLGKCGGFESDVVTGMYWAAGFWTTDNHDLPPPLLIDTSLPPNAHPAQVLNLSLGDESACDEVYALVVKEITARGVLVVASAGNEGKAVGAPANCPGVLAVAGLRQAGTKVGYSNLGPEVGIAAPAGNCVLTGPTDPCLFALNSTTNFGASTPGADGYSSPLLQPSYGTSFSAPLAAATAGLMKAVNPALTPTLLVARIRETARAFPTSSDTQPQPQACRTPGTGVATQDLECLCNTQVCGAGMLDAAAAVQAALRPAALAQVTGTVRTGQTLVLDGSHSAAATGRTLVNWQWSVVSATGGATTPAIGAANQPIASVPAPAFGSIVLRLSVTDNAGSSDSATVTITGTGTATTDAPPPQPEVSRSGGGNFDGWLLALIALLLAARVTRRNASSIARR